MEKKQSITTVFHTRLFYLMVAALVVTFAISYTMQTRQAIDNAHGIIARELSYLCDQTQHSYRENALLKQRLDEDLINKAETFGLLLQLQPRLTFDMNLLERTVKNYGLLGVDITDDTGMVVALWFYPVDFYGAVNGTGIVKQLWKLLLDIVPGDIASPFLKGNSLQIIFLAVCSGIIMLMLGKQTENVLTDVGQINNIVLTGMNSVSVLTPYIVFVCVLNMIICGINIPTSLLLKIFLLAWGVEFLVQIYFTLRLAYKGHVSPSLIFKKLLPTYIIAFSTGSSAAAFSSNSHCCNKELGISQKLTDLGIPLMQALFKPGAAIAYMVLSLTMAEMYSVPINPSWLLVAIIMSGMLSMAGQPSSAGGDVISLTILCLQLGIPMEALVLAIPLDQLLDFKGTATSVWSGMAGLGIVADSVGMLKEETLKKEI